MVHSLMYRYWFNHFCGKSYSRKTRLFSILFVVVFQLYASYFDKQNVPDSGLFIKRVVKAWEKYI